MPVNSISSGINTNKIMNDYSFSGNLAQDFLSVKNFVAIS